MLLMRKKEITNDKISYYYQPEFKGKMGVVSYLIEENKLEIEKLAEQDDEKIYSFRRHALKYLKKFYKEKNYPEEKTIYWGW